MLVIFLFPFPIFQTLVLPYEMFQGKLSFYILLEALLYIILFWRDGISKIDTNSRKRLSHFCENGQQVEVSRRKYMWD